MIVKEGRWSTGGNRPWQYVWPLSLSQANKQKVKPIVGCEFYLVEDRFQKSFVGGRKISAIISYFLQKISKDMKPLQALLLGFIEGLYSVAKGRF